eukprot:CAMPEP_0197523972 /NCGR_PEP_ID=MMETSP1318-20131121/8772_1 /TAXON_ID=552666 /ORGANISM="Partenskyella glossopodia, Strain RCC365" /LENGTH=380 /DNA_ID=CAMNT_0043076807 /DNA_START=132 /DNA_END=1274 /DNA_ORIENTATION=+
MTGRKYWSSAAAAAVVAAYVVAAASAGQTRLGFGNDCRAPISISWVDHNGQEQEVIKEVVPQNQAWITSYMGHKFVFRGVSDGGKVGEATVTAPHQFVAIQCNHPCHTDYGSEECLSSLVGYTDKDALQPAWDHMNEKRERVNFAQPRHLKNFTKLGFEKMPIPDSVWQVLNRYYQDNKDSIVLEKWPPNNPYINHWEAVPMMIWLPELHTGDNTKQDIFDGLTPVLEEWSGTKLVQTDMYGMRVYKNNTFLENHVDRIATHVVSAIMHIADSSDHEWPLNIFDHEGNEHNVTIAPGEMVLYESATCRHGRPSKFQGDYYVNAFAHYRPVDWIPTLRELRREGKISEWSLGPGDLDKEWLEDEPEVAASTVGESSVHDDL